MITLTWYWYLLSLSAMATIGFILCGLLTSGELHKQADKIHAEKLAEIESSEQKDDYIDWSKVPEGYDWVAVDRNESITDGVWAYNNDNKNIKMIIKDGCWMPKDDRCEVFRVDESDAIIGQLPPWRESLRRRTVK